MEAFIGIALLLVFVAFMISRALADKSFKNIPDEHRPTSQEDERAFWDDQARAGPESGD